MSEFTYESKTSSSPLETFEWDNVWWEQTDNSASKRVVYIGDSVSCATRHFATRLSDNKILFDGFGTSKALDNPFFIKTLSTFIEQEQKIDAILFNNGLHGWHLSTEEYDKKYGEMLEFLKRTSDAPVFVVLTTNLPGDEKRNPIVIKRNEIAKKYAEKFGFSCIDLYSVSVKYSHLHAPDNVHFSNEGYEELAKCILKALGSL